MRIDFTGRPGLLAATGNHPFARYSIAGEDTVGQVDGDCVAWWARRRSGQVLTVLGDPAAALRIAARSPTPVMDLPRLPAGNGQDWEFRWTRTSPDVDDPRVAELTASDWPRVTELLCAELPYTTNWPGNADIHAWYGIWDNDRLIATAADRSRYDVGYLVAIAVVAERQRQGLARALAGTLTTRLLKRYDVCALAIHAGNPTGQAAFTALGYRDAELRTLVQPQPV